MAFSADVATRVRRSVAVAASLALTVFFFLPLTLYFPHLPQFGSSPYELVPLLFALSLACAVVIVLLQLLLLFVWRRAYDYTLSLLFGLSILVWLQGNILVGNYGPLDGRPLQMDGLPSILRFDAALWVIVAVLAIVLARRFARHAVAISAIIIAIQLVGVGTAAYRAPAAFPAQSQQASAGFFEFSKRRNVLLIVLDSYQGDLFEEILQKDPAYTKGLDGFTFYRNAVGGFTTTRPMLALLLSGEYYQNEQPLNEFLLNAYVERSVSRRLKDKGFRVGIARNERGIQLMYCDQRVAHACVRLQDLAARNPPPLQEAAGLYDLALFRAAPHAAKPWLYNDAKWRLGLRWSGMQVPGIHGEDIRFVEIFSERARPNASEAGTFKFLHLFSPHPPFVMDENLLPAAMPYSRASCKRQCMGTLRLVDNILSTLKRIDVYDNTMILVVGDHGARISMPVDVGLLDYEFSNPPQLSLRNVKSSALPLVLVKPFGSRGPLRTSNAPVSLGDVAKTIAVGGGLEADIPGTSILEIAEDAERARRFYHYQGYDWKTPFPTMKEYRIDGFSWFDESWHDTLRTLTAKEAKTDAP